MKQRVLSEALIKKLRNTKVLDITSNSQTSNEEVDVLFVSSWKISCGIATYTENLVESLKLNGLSCSVFPLEKSKWKYWIKSDIDQFENSFQSALRQCKIVHFQHEPALFGGVRGSNFAIKKFEKMIKIAKSENKKIIITFHTDFFDFSNKKYRGFKRIIKNISKHMKIFKYKKISKLIKQLNAEIIVHSEKSKFCCSKIGIPDTQIHILTHPTLNSIDVAEEISNKNRRALSFSSGDVVLTIFGFVSYYKGHDTAIKALRLLPKNYKLIVIGGSHPESDDRFLNDIIRLTKKNNLQDRVLITGWIESGKAIEYLSCADICLAPYRETGLSGSGALTWALGIKKPLILSKIEAFRPMRAIIEDLLFVTPDAPHELAWAIDNLANNIKSKIANADRYKNQIHEYIEKYSWKNAAKFHIVIYKIFAVQR